MVLGVYADSAYRMAVLAGGNVGIGTTDPSRLLDVLLTATNASLHNNNTAAVHFGSGSGNANSDGYIQGISLGYKSTGANTYAKTAIVARGLNDGAARQSLAFLVDTAADGGSAEIGDAKLTIHGTTGAVTQPSQPVAIYTHSTSSEAGAYAYSFGGTGAQTVLCKPQGAVVNRGSMYDAGNGRFTAPVAGIYRYAVHGNLYTNGLHANAYFTWRIYKNGAHYLYHYTSNGIYSANGWVYQNAGGLISLAANEYIQFELKTNNLLSNNFGMDLSSYTHYEFALLY